MSKAPDWLGLRSNSHPDYPFLLYKTLTYTFRQVDLLTNKVGQQMFSSGNPGESPTAGILVTDPLLTCLLVLAAVRFNRPAVVLNHKLSDRQLQDQCSILNLRQIFVNSRESSQIGRNLGFKCSKKLVSTPAVSQLPKCGKQISCNTMRGDMNKLQGYVFTSGTTGAHKATPLTFANHFWSATASAYRLGYSLEDCWLHCMPLSHVGGLSLLFRSLLFGFGLHLIAGFNINEILESVLRGRVTLASFVPTMLVRLLESNLCVRGSSVPFRFALLGGAKVPAALLEKSQSQGIEVIASYGMTETCSHISSVFPQGTKGQKGVGLPLPFAQITIRGDDLLELPAHIRGEIWVKWTASLSSESRLGRLVTFWRFWLLG